MKKIVLLLLLGMVLIASNALAEQGPPADLDKLNANAEERFHVRKESDGEVVFSRGRTRPYPGKPREAAKNFLREYHRMFKLSAGLHEIKFEKQGGTRDLPDVYYTQKYKGIPVLAGGISIFMDSRNRIIRVIDAIKEISGLNTEPVIQPDELEELLGRNVPAYGPIVVGPELIVYTFGKEPVLAYELEAYETGTENNMMLFVDTTTGEILKVVKTIWHFSGPDTQQPSETAGNTLAGDWVENGPMFGLYCGPWFITL